MREAYSHEVISHGFWPGSGPILEPAFYAYAVPEPPGLKTAAVQPRRPTITGISASSSFPTKPYDEPPIQLEPFNCSSTARMSGRPPLVAGIGLHSSVVGVRPVTKL